MDRPIPNEEHYVASTSTHTPEAKLQFKWKVRNLRRFIEFSSEIMPTSSAKRHSTAGVLPFWIVSELCIGYDDAKATGD